MKTKMKRFRASVPAASVYLKQLVDAGALVISETESEVRVQRQQQIATIDTMGRVKWEPAPAAVRACHRRR